VSQSFTKEEEDRMNDFSKMTSADPINEVEVEVGSNSQNKNFR
jgi:hypothetical protein